MCAIEALSLQVQPTDAASVKKETSKDSVLARVMRLTQEGWPQDLPPGDPAKQFQKISQSLSTCHDCSLYGMRLVIPSSLQDSVLQLLHTSHLGMQKMKQLARTAVYWPNIDEQTMDLCRSCTSCCEHRRVPSKPEIHLWVMPEKPWSRLHIDHAINFMGHYWLVITDAYIKYPCIHPTGSVSTKSTIELLEEYFAHFFF